MITKIIKNKLFWIFFAFISLFSGIFYILYFTNLFILKEIVISNTTKISKEEIIKATELKGGEKLFTIPINKIRKKILINPLIEEVIIVRHLPHTLEIKVKEREPLAIIVQNNKGYLIDKEGVLLTPIIPEDYQFYPVIEIKNEEFKKSLLNFLDWIREHKNYLPVYENLSKVVLEENKIVFITKHDITIYFPLVSQKDWTYFYKNLDRIITYLYEKELIEKVELIRMDYPLGVALIKFRS